MIDLSSRVVFLEDFEAGLESLPHGQDNENKQAIRDTASYDVDRLGACFCFVPTGAIAKAKAALTLLEESAEIVRKFRRLFHIDNKQHRFSPSPEAVRYVTAGNLYGYGCSREGMITIQAAVVKAIVHDTKINIRNSAIGIGLPSRATLANREPNLAAATVAHLAYDAIKNKVDGHRTRIDHRPWQQSGSRSLCEGRCDTDSR